MEAVRARGPFLNRCQVKSQLPRTSGVFTIQTSVQQQIPSILSIGVTTATEDKVYHALCAIRPQVALGPDGIMGWMGASLSIYSSLTTIFNASLRLGRVPSAWKNSNVTPIFKSGNAGLA